MYRVSVYGVKVDEVDCQLVICRGYISAPLDTFQEFFAIDGSLVNGHQTKKIVNLSSFQVQFQSVVNGLRDPK